MYFDEIFGVNNIIIDVYREKSEGTPTSNLNQRLCIFVLFPLDLEDLNKFMTVEKRYTPRNKNIDI